MRNKKRNKYLLLLALLLLVTVGYALISTTLKINGTASITKNIWSVYWEPTSVAVTQGSKGSTIPTVSNGTDGSINTKVTWSVNFELPGDFYEFTVDAANAGTIDAEITGITPTIPQDLPSYISYSVTYADGVTPAVHHLLEKGTKSGNTITPTTEKYKVRIEFLDTITPTEMNEIDDEGVSYEFGYEVQYGQATDQAISKPVWILPQGKTASTLSVGDEICLAADQTQCFNFIKYDGNDVVMLAKYNLKIGDIISSGTTAYRYTSNDEGYNKQSSEVRGNVNASQYNGTLPFSATYYWDGNVSSYPADVYDATNYKTEPDFSTTCDSTHCYKTPGYSVAYYVEEYKDILETTGATIKNARLLTYSEATDSSIGCVASNYRCPTTGTSSFIINTTFWLGSAGDYMSVWYVNYDGLFYGSRYNVGIVAGVRPVIVVEKSNL